jgi:hypothetical protein
MNLPLARAVLSGCLNGLKWMLWTIAVLLAVLFAIAYLRPQGGDSPLRMIGLGMVVSAAAGWACGRLSRIIESAALD